MNKVAALGAAAMLLALCAADARSYVQPPPSLAGLKGLKSVTLDVQVMGADGNGSATAKAPGSTSATST